MITLTDLHRTFGSPPHDVAALDGVSLSVRRGEIFGVVGHSGAGKSTLLRCVNLLERPDSGTVEVDGVDLTALRGTALHRARHGIGMVFQHFNLLANRTLAQNVEFALEAVGEKGASKRTHALEALELVGLADRARSYPAQLSGGQKQRVGIARALATRPAVLLSDESTSALDPATTAQILTLLRELRDELGLTVLLITHDMGVVKAACDSAALLVRGRIVEQGRLSDLIATPGSAIADQLFPLGEVPAVTSGSAVVDVTFSGASAERPVIAHLTRHWNVDASILGAAIEDVGGAQAGRTRLSFPAGAPVSDIVGDLRGQGLIVDVLGTGETGGGQVGGPDGSGGQDGGTGAGA